MRVYVLEVEQSRNGKRQAHCMCGCGYAALFIDYNEVNMAAEKHLNHKHPGSTEVAYLTDTMFI